MFFLFVLIVLLLGSSVVLVHMSIAPLFVDKAVAWKDKKEKTVAIEMDKMFYDKNPKAIVRLYFILPPAIALVVFLVTGNVLFMAGGALLGFTIPNFVLKGRNANRRRKFNNQILDAIMVLSSSLKGGLSLLQALEVVVEEVPAPMSQEVGLVVRENKMGVTLEDSLRHLSRRMDMEELNLVINSVLVARETGGDLTKVLSRLSTTLRDNRKLKESIQTLTLQGRLQGVIMSALPILFAWWVITFNKEHFSIMLKNDTGRTMLIAAVVLQVIGMLLIKRFSTIRI